MEEQNIQVQTTKKGFDFHKVFAAIGVILFVSIPVVAGIWYFTDGRFTNYGTDADDTYKTSTDSAKKSTNSATESADKDETADWKTYTTEDFSFNYPPDFKPVTKNGNTIVTNDEGGDPKSVAIGTIEVYSRVATDNDKPDINITTFDLGGEKASKGEGENSGRFTLVYFVDSVNLKSSGVNKFVFICAVPIEGSDSVKTCDQIASTFKFL